MRFRNHIALLLLLVILPLQGGDRVRKYLTTGGWYPSSETELWNLMDRLFSRSRTLEIPGSVVGLVAPHAGFSYSGECAARAYRQLENRLDRIKRIILLGSSHHAGFYGACVSEFTHWATPMGKIALDRKIVDRLARQPGFQTDNRIMEHEHSLENQLPFIQWMFRDRPVRIIPILFGRLGREDYPRMAAAVARHIDDSTLVVASSDLNHYGRNFGYTPFTTDIEANLTRLDRGMIGKITALDVEGYFTYMNRTGITMCGFVPVGILLHLFPPDRYSTRLADYSKSGDRNGDYSLSVSYASVVIHEGGGGGGLPSGADTKTPQTGLTFREQRILLKLARDTLTRYLKPGAPAPGDENRIGITWAMRKKTGTFVTLKIEDQLRGCIGSLVGEKPLFQGVMDNVINAATRDPRFTPVRKEELDRIHIEISVMTPLKRIDDYRKIRLGVDGVVIERGYHRAVFLPQVAVETGWTLEEFLGQLCRKAGLDRGAYRSQGMVFFVFQAQVFGEEKQ